MKILKDLRENFKLKQEELANKIDLEQNTIAQYEADKYPSFKVLKKISILFKVSIDYLLLEDKCFYPRNLNYIKSTITLDNNNNSEMKSLIKKNINSLTKHIENQSIKINLDDIGENLKDNFHSNLKTLRQINNLTQKQIANELNIAEPVVSFYEKKNYPSIDKMIKLSEIFNCSIHALVTGEKLTFDFKDKNFGKIILLSDHLLSIEDKNFLIKLMGNFLK